MIANTINVKVIYTVIPSMYLLDLPVTNMYMKYPNTKKLDCNVKYRNNHKPLNKENGSSTAEVMMLIVTPVIANNAIVNLMYLFILSPKNIIP